MWQLVELKKLSIFEAIQSILKYIFNFFIKTYLKDVSLVSVVFLQLNIYTSIINSN